MIVHTMKVNGVQNCNFYSALCFSMFKHACSQVTALTEWMNQLVSPSECHGSHISHFVANKLAGAQVTYMSQFCGWPLKPFTVCQHFIQLQPEFRFSRMWNALCSWFVHPIEHIYNIYVVCWWYITRCVAKMSIK